MGLGAEFGAELLAWRKGNVADPAVGVIIGARPSEKIVSSLVGYMFMPALAAHLSFTSRTWLPFSRCKDPTGSDVLIIYGALPADDFRFHHHRAGFVHRDQGYQ